MKTKIINTPTKYNLLPKTTEQSLIECVRDSFKLSPNYQLLSQKEVRDLIKTNFSRPNSFIVLLEEEKNKDCKEYKGVVGFALIYTRSKGFYWISKLGISPQYQGLGHSKELMKSIIEEIKKREKTKSEYNSDRFNFRIGLKTRSNNHKSKNLYQQFGFETKYTILCNSKNRLITAYKEENDQIYFREVLFLILN